MKKKFSKKYSWLTLTAMLFFGQIGSAQNNSNRMWKDVTESSIEITGQRGCIPKIYRTLHLDGTDMRQWLSQAPKEPANGDKSGKNGLLFSMPMPDGTFSTFRIFEIYILHPDLAAKFPEIKTYAGQGIDDAAATVWLDFTPLGFHAMVLSPKGNIFIDPYCNDNIKDYICYDKKNLTRTNAFICETQGDDPSSHRLLPSDFPSQKTSGGSLRTYRLALACTGEYAATKGGTVNGALAGMTTTMTRVDGVYETEVAIRFVMVANNNLIVYTNASTDPYTNNNGSTMLTQNQTTCDGVIGAANYDIGHVFSTGGGGVAFLGVVCTAGSKAGGVTGLTNPVGDAFDIDYVAHEMGHQHGGNHTFNSVTGSCGGGNRAASAAYEPGSGITIMAYAGICGTDDLAAHSIAYFHTKSFDEIVNYTTLSGGSTCGTNVASGNTPPVVTSQGSNYTIPISTPFVLTGAATDANATDTITYSWEEMDLGTAGAWNANLSSAPLFRPFPPAQSPSRTFPQLSDIINNTTTVGEILPNVARSMHFRLTARDNRMGGGGVMHPDTNVTITVAGTSAFAVTAPNTAVTWAGSSSQTIMWNVSGTNMAPISCANVKISLSTDGGITYPTVILASTPNDGMQSITVPNIATTSARIKVEAVGNIFFDISNFNFTITATTGLSIITTVISPLTYCAGAAVNVPYNINALANAGNVFTAQLSNDSGSFSSPVNIGTLMSTSGGTISAIIPAGTATGTGYRIRVVSSNPAVTGSDNGSNISISAQVGAAGAISGPSAVCAGSNQITFSVNPVANATSYNWTLPAGASILGANNTASIIVSFTSNASSGSISVYGSNTSCIGTSSSLSLTVNPLPVVTAANVSGCAGTAIALSGTPAGGTWSVANPYMGASTTYTHMYTDGNGCTNTSASATITVNSLPSVSFSGLASSYTVTSAPVTLTGSPASGVFSGPGISGNTFSPTVAGVGGPYTITYTYTNANNCTNSSSRQTSVTSCTTPATPGTISRTGGGANVCPGDSRTYSIAAVAGATSYTWTPPAGATISSGQGTVSIVVNYNAGFVANDTLHVRANNLCGSSNEQILTVARNLPSTPGVISGQTFGLCNQNAVPYSVTNVAGITYNWSFSVATASIASGQGGNAVTANFGPTYVSGAIRVSANNNCGASALRSLTVRATPATPSAITGDPSVCVNQFGVPYSTTPVVSATNYTWTCPTNARISDGVVTSTTTTLITTASSVTINYAASTGNVRVRGNNACGSGSYRSLAITFVCRENAGATEVFPVTCYPQPASGMLNIGFNSTDASSYSISLNDITGKQVQYLKGQSEEGQNKISINISTIAQGIYMLEIVKGTERNIQKIIIE